MVAGLIEGAWLRTAMVMTGLVGTGVVLTGAGCGSSDCTFDATCGQPADAGTDADINWPANCPVGGDPKDYASCVDDRIGVFVSSRGNPATGDGSRLNPFRNLEQALPRYSRQRHRIYICDGEYAGNWTIGIAQSGLEIYGGFSCQNWAYTGERSRIIAQDPNVPAARWKDVSIGKARDLEISFAAPGDATNDGASSIAVYVSGSTLEFQRVKFVARNGKNGANGVLQGMTFPGAGALKGKDAAEGGGETRVVCQGDEFTSVGGAGGGTGATDGDGKPGTPALGGGTAGTRDACSASNTGGGNGRPGTPGKNGDGAASVGRPGPDNWAGEPGVSGANGSPGQGGGGGGGVAGATGGAGGGGAAGGCGGTGGPGGQAGGASIALVSVGSRVTLVESELASAGAANGGNGASGQPGQSFGGARGAGAGNGCSGGSGGVGGAGGVGGGGAGGISVGIVSTDMAPTFDAATEGRITVGAAGTGGTGPSPSKPAVNGVSQKVLAL